MNLEMIKSKTQEASKLDYTSEQDGALWVALITIGNVVNSPERSDKEKEEILREIMLLINRN